MPEKKINWEKIGVIAALSISLIGGIGFYFTSTANAQSRNDSQDKAIEAQAKMIESQSKEIQSSREILVRIDERLKQVQQALERHEAATMRP